MTPGSEICDSQDNDCDGATDEDFDLNTDLNNCGACGQSCWSNPPANAYPDACNSGTCHYVCSYGYNDLNGDLNTQGGDGCEYACPVTPPGNEYCDGQDNDCDGLTDENLTPPAGYCNQGIDGPSPPDPGTDANNPCKGTVAICTDPDGSGPLQYGWYCQYPASVETDPNNPNVLLGYETLCDGKDGDCDGVPDDGFGVGEECDNGRQGRCRVTGTVVCDASDPTSTVCDLPDPSTWPDPTDEVCDAVDNDCDGLTDENAWENDPANDPSGVQGYVVDDKVAISVSGNTVWVYTFEASRPTATATDPGSGTGLRACSRQGVMPWSFVTFKQAAQACARAGMRLCRADEWYEACNGDSVTYVYPYGNTYDPGACNGHDADPNADQAEPTGTQLNCASYGYGAEDLSGNLREWTDDLVGWSSTNKKIFRVRGGSFQDLETGLRCDFDTAAYTEDALASHVGFRCCTTCGNGVVDTDVGETCDPAPPASSPNCNPVYCGPDTCGNGVTDPGEECDDGNLLPLDGCSPQCRLEADIAYTETFDTCPPSGWVVQNGGEGSATWECCPGSSCTANQGNETWSDSAGSFIKADSNEAPWYEAMDEGLVTPAFDFRGARIVVLAFYHYYDDDTGGDYGYVQYSLNGQSGPWTTLATFNADDRGYVELDVTAQVAGQANVAFRFRYVDGDTQARYWKLDDVSVYAY